jgi:IclR family acetate operon transcriptional repressor
VGIHDSAHATALGKCILGVLDEDSRQDYLARHPLHQLTRRTMTDRQQLEYAIGQSAPLGRDDEEYALGVHCVATPVVTPELTGAVAVARRQGSALRPTDPEVAHSLVVAAQRIVRSLAMPVSV